MSPECQALLYLNLRCVPIAGRLCIMYYRSQTEQYNRWNFIWGERKCPCEQKMNVCSTVDISCHSLDIWHCIDTVVMVVRRLVARVLICGSVSLRGRDIRYKCQHTAASQNPPHVQSTPSNHWVKAHRNLVWPIDRHWGQIHWVIRDLNLKLTPSLQYLYFGPLAKYFLLQRAILQKWAM